MNRFKKHLLGAAVLLLTLSATAHGSEISKLVEAENQKVEAAFLESDAAGVADVYTTNGMLLPPNGNVVNGIQDIKVFWQGVIDAGIAKVDLETVELDEQGDTAIEIGQYKLFGADGSTVDNGKYVVVWKVEDNRWKWHRDIWNSDNPG